MSQELFFQPLGRIKYVRALFTEQGPKRTALGILQVVQWLDPWVKLLGIFVGFCCWWKAEDKSPSDLGPSLWLSHRRFPQAPSISTKKLHPDTEGRSQHCLLGKNVMTLPFPPSPYFKTRIWSENLSSGKHLCLLYFSQFWIMNTFKDTEKVQEETRWC